jgi:hypothetical protein
MTRGRLRRRRATRLGNRASRRTPAPTARGMQRRSSFEFDGVSAP